MRCKVILFVLLIILLSSVVIAVHDKDPCKKIRDNEQAKGMANKDLVEKVPNKVWYKTKIVGAVYHTRHTEFVPKDILKVFDAFVPLFSGEIALYANVKKGSSYSCEQIGIVYGEIDYIGVSSVPFKIKNGNFRKAFKRGSSYNEFMLYDKSGKGVDFAMAKNRYGMYELFASGEEVITYSTDSKPKIDYFLHPHKSLPSSLFAGSTNYYKIGVNSSNDKCSIYWYMKYNYDSFAVSGNCSVSRESSNTLAIGKETLYKNRNVYTTGVTYDSKSDSYTYDSMIKTGKSWVSFSIVPNKIHSFYKKYVLQFYGKKKFEFDDIKFLRNSVKPRIEVLDFNGLKRNMIHSKSWIMVQLPPINTRILYNFLTYGANKKYGRIILEDSNGDVDLLISEGNIALVPGTMTINQSAEVQNEINGLYDRAREILDVDEEANHFRVTKYVKGTEDLKIIYPSFRTLYNEAKVKNKVQLPIKESSKKHKVVTLYHKASRKAVVFFQGEEVNLYKLNSRRTPYKWVQGVIGSLKFSTYIYDDVAEKVRLLKCSSVNGICTLDGEKISQPKNYVGCRVSSQCSGNNVCLNSICVGQKIKCKDYIKGGNLDLHIFGTDMTEKEIKTFLDKTTKTMFSLEPLKTNKNKFSIKYQTIGTFSDFNSNNLNYKSGNSKRNARLDAQSCIGSSADIKILLVPLKFRSFASGNRFFLSLKSGLPDYTFVHEFGHAFGKLVDEYIEKTDKDDIDCDLGINCNLPIAADYLWTRLGLSTLAEFAMDKKWYGCGACNAKPAKPYLRPSDNSMMNDHRVDNVQFNSVSKKVLEKRFSAY